MRICSRHKKRILFILKDKTTHGTHGTVPREKLGGVQFRIQRIKLQRHPKEFHHLVVVQDVGEAVVIVVIFQNEFVPLFEFLNVVGEEQRLKGVVE